MVLVAVVGDEGGKCGLFPGRRCTHCLGKAKGKDAKCRYGRKRGSKVMDGWWCLIDGSPELDTHPHMDEREVQGESIRCVVDGEVPNCRCGRKGKGQG